MTPEQVRVVLDALEFQEGEWMKRVEREPKTRGGKPNLLRAMLQQDLNALADAKHAFKSAKINQQVQTVG